MELSEFLLARIAEDEAVLNRTESFPHASHGYDSLGTYSATCPTCRQMVWGSRQRALAECEAKRRIVERLTDLGAHFADTGRQMPDMTSAMLIDGIGADLALPYAGHPDYRDEWRP